MGRKKRKIMTISDLYTFCVNNNFYHFNSIENKEEICVQMPAIFEKAEAIDKDKEGLTPFVAKAYHDHINLNRSEIKPEVLESTLPSAMLRPILASIIVDEETGEKDFNSHDMVIEEDENGNEIIRYIEQPVGVIFGDNTIEYDEEDDVNRAILHGYLFDGYCQDAVDIMNRRKTVDCSVELSIREMSFNAKDKVLTLDDFYVSGLTLLGSKVNPGMKGSQVTIEDFSKNNNSMFAQNNKLIEMLEQLNTKIDNLSNFTIQGLSQSTKEGGNEAVKFKELLEKYSKTEEDITFEIEGLSDEELEAKFAEVFGETEDSDEDENSDEGADDTATQTASENGDDDSDDGEDDDEGNDNQESFSEKLVRTYEISHEDIRYALYNLLTTYEESDNEWYWITNVYDTYFVYENWCGDKIFGQSYAKDEDNVSLDGERWELFKELLTASEKAELESMRSNYASIKSQLEEYQAKELNAQKDALFSSDDYKGIAESEAFAELKKEAEKYSVEELTDKLDKIIAESVKKGTFSFVSEENKPKSNRVNFAQTLTADKPKKNSFLDGLLNKTN